MNQIDLDLYQQQLQSMRSYQQGIANQLGGLGGVHHPAQPYYPPHTVGLVAEQKQNESLTQDELLLLLEDVK